MGHARPHLRSAIPLKAQWCLDCGSQSPAVDMSYRRLNANPHQRISEFEFILSLSLTSFFSSTAWLETLYTLPIAAPEGIPPTCQSDWRIESPGVRRNRRRTMFTSVSPSKRAIPRNVDVQTDSSSRGYTKLRCLLSLLCKEGRFLYWYPTSEHPTVAMAASTANLLRIVGALSSSRGSLLMLNWYIVKLGHH
jgi:hypothetical protein